MTRRLFLMPGPLGQSDRTPPKHILTLGMPISSPIQRAAPMHREERTMRSEAIALLVCMPAVERGRLLIKWIPCTPGHRRRAQPTPFPCCGAVLRRPNFHWRWPRSAQRGLRLTGCSTSAPSRRPPRPRSSAIHRPGVGGAVQPSGFLSERVMDGLGQRGRGAGGMALFFREAWPHAPWRPAAVLSA